VVKNENNGDMGGSRGKSRGRGIGGPGSAASAPTLGGSPAGPARQAPFWHTRLLRGCWVQQPTAANRCARGTPAQCGPPCAPRTGCWFCSVFVLPSRSPPVRLSAQDFRASRGQAFRGPGLSRWPSLLCLCHAPQQPWTSTPMECSVLGKITNDDPIMRLFFFFFYHRRNPCVTRGTV